MKSFSVGNCWSISRLRRDEILLKDDITSKWGRQSNFNLSKWLEHKHDELELNDNLSKSSVHKLKKGKILALHSRQDQRFWCTI